MKTYSQCIKIPDYNERFQYLKLLGSVCERTFGGYRELNQILYRCPEWKGIRRKVILRDNGNDLAHPDHPIRGRILVHHIEPITVEDIRDRTQKVFDLDNLISCSHQTHNAIHYSGDAKLDSGPIVRLPNDTAPWR